MWSMMESKKKNLNRKKPYAVIARVRVKKERNDSSKKQIVGTDSNRSVSSNSLFN